MNTQESQIKQLIESGTKENIHLGFTLLDAFQIEKNKFLSEHYHSIFVFLYTDFHEKYKSFADIPLEELMKELYYFFDTTELDLDHGDFPTLPQILPFLYQLKELYLCRVVVGETNSIEDLLLSEVNTTEMINLLSIEISQSLHKNLPKGIHKLENLQEALFYQNTLDKISDEFWTLSNLELIDFSYNKLDKIPSQIAYLQKLNRANFSHNKIATIPIEIKDCKELVGLEFRSNELKEIPTELFSLPKLEWLYLDDNYITEISADIQELKSLRWLHLTGNPLSQGELLKLQVLLPDCKIVF